MNADEDALRLVASKADGALRDALSIFDQLVTSVGQDLTYAKAAAHLNVLDVNNFFRITDFIFSDQVSDALILLDDILAKGFDGQNFITGLATHFRNLLMAQNPATLPLLEASDSVKQQFQQQSRSADRMLLIRALELTNQCDLNYKEAHNKRLTIELCLMQINANYIYKKARQSQESGAPTAQAAPQTATAQSTIPKMSQAPFNFPGYPAVQQIPTIKELTSRQSAEVDSQDETHTQDQQEPSAEPQQEQHPQEESSEPKEETLESNWNEVVEAIFKNLPMLYYILKKTQPTYQDDILTVEVSNGIQEEELRQRKRAVLEYWRHHFKMNVDDFEIVVNESKVIETAILTSDEQFQKMKEQNPELKEFLNILKFSMKN